MNDELPEGWVDAPLGQLCTKPQYGWTTSAKKERDGIKLLRTTDISNGNIDWLSVPVCEEVPADPTKYLLRAGDLVVSRAGSVGISHLIAGDIPRAVFASYLIRFRPLQDIPSGFLRLFLDSPRYWRAIHQEAAGIAVQNINASKLADLVVPLPPLPEQHRIVEKVETLLEQVNRAKERLDRVPRILKRFRQAVLAAACSGELTREWRESHPAVQPARDLLAAISARRTALKLPTASRLIPDEGIEIPESELPDSWRWCRVGQIADVRLGGTPARKEPSYWNGSIPWVSSGEVANFRISGTAERITKKGLESSNAKVYPAGSVLIAMIGEGKTRGQSAILDIDACTNQNVAGLIFDAGLVNPEYIWYWALQEYTKNREEGRGGNQAALNGAKVRALPLPLPPVNEQAEIVRVLKNMLRLASAIDARVNVATTRANKLPQAILSKAFSGELVPTEAELARLEGRTYETAEELLKRVTALGSDAPSARKGLGTRAR